MNKRNKKWLCVYCNKDTKYEHFYLRNEVWYKIHNSPVGMVCLSCCEVTLGRQLKKADFTDAYINRVNFGEKSAELVKRLST